MKEKHGRRRVLIQKKSKWPQQLRVLIDVSQMETLLFENLFDLRSNICYLPCSFIHSFRRIKLTCCIKYNTWRNINIFPPSDFLMAGNFLSPLHSSVPLFDITFDLRLSSFPRGFRRCSFGISRVFQSKNKKNKDEWRAPQQLPAGPKP